MALGQAKTTKFSIGTAELRIGPLNMANKLTQAHSVGLVDSVTVSVSQETVDLEGGFPKKVIQTAVVSQKAELKATLREYSRRNIRVLLGDGVAGAEPTDISGTIAATAIVGATSVSVTDGQATGIVANDIIVIYGATAPENVTVAKVASINTAGSPDVITLDSDTPLLHALAIGDKFFIARQVAIGNITQTNYFSVQVVQRENSSGRPTIFNFWKAAIASGMEYGTNASDFASTELSLKILEPATCEYDVGGELLHLADIIPTHPVGMFIGGADDSAC